MARDLEALRGVVASAFKQVFVDSVGTIVGMTPGDAMERQGLDAVVYLNGELAVGPRADVPCHVDEDGHFRTKCSR